MPSFRSIIDNKIIRTLLVVFLVSLLVRLVFFGFTLEQMSEPQIRTATPDVGAYFDHSDCILNLDFLDPKLNGFGPGHPIYIALLRIFSADDARVMLGINVVVGALGSFLLSLLAWNLTENRWVALLAGLLHALSPSAISLSLILLSDTLFFALLIAGLVLFARAVQSNKFSLFVICGFWFGLLPLVRSIATYFILLLPIFAWLIIRQTSLSSRLTAGRRLIPPILTAVLSIALLFAYTFRPRAPEDPPVSYPAYNGMMKLSSRIQCEVNGTTYKTEADNFWHTADARKESTGEHIMAIFLDQSVTELKACLIEHPIVSARVLWNNTWSNSNSEHILIWASLPEWADTYRLMENWMGGHFLNYRNLLLTLIGLVFLWRDRRFDLIGISVLIYAYFLATSSMTLEWGNRTFYPGLIGLFIPAAYGLYAIFEKLRRWRVSSVRP